MASRSVSFWDWVKVPLTFTKVRVRASFFSLRFFTTNKIVKLIYLTALKLDFQDPSVIFIRNYEVQ